MTVDLARAFLVRTGPKGEAGLLDAGEGGIEFAVVDKESVVLGAHVRGIDEVERDAVAGLHRTKRPPLWPRFDTEDGGEELRRSILVLGRNDDVVEGCHDATGRRVETAPPPLASDGHRREGPPASGTCARRSGSWGRAGRRLRRYRSRAVPAGS